MTEKKCVIGIDVGTTSVKAVAFDEQGNELTRASRTVESFMDDSGMAEQDVLSIYELVTTAFSDTVKQVRSLGYFVDKVGFSAAMHSLLMAKADGTPLSRAMTWVDTRSKADAERLWASTEGKALYERTGTPTHPMTPLSKMLWLKRAKPVEYRNSERFVSIKEWLWFQWFGEWCVDESMAGATGIYNMETRSWDADALGLLDIRAEQLSRIVPTTYVKSNVCDGKLLTSGVSAHTRFNIGASDGVLANLGVGVIDRRSVAMTIGTSCAVRMGSNRPATDVGTRFFCYVLSKDHYIVGGPSNSGGLVLDWLQRHVFSPESGSLDGIESLISSAGEASIDDLYCLPYLTGERAPLWNADASASFIGLQFHHERQHLVRAAVEGIIFNAYWIAHRLIEQLGMPQTLVVSGKLFQETWVRQFVADVFGLPVRYTDVDASVLGAVTLANIACGDWTWSDAQKRADSGQGESLSPRIENRETYQDKFRVYRTLCQKLLATPGL